jgi:microcystin-dependent protein
MFRAMPANMKSPLLRQAMLLVVAAVAILIPVTSAHAATPRPPSLPSGDSLLFAVQADSGSLTKVSGSRYRLTLRGVSRQSIWFADRPARDTGRMLTRSLVRNWGGLGFVSDRPNALLSTFGKGPDDVVIELGRPRLLRSGTTLKIRVRVLGREKAGLRRRFGAASMVIDNATVTGGCGYTGQIRFFPRRVTPGDGNLLPADGSQRSAAALKELYSVIGTRFGGNSAFPQLPNVPAPDGMHAMICPAGEDPAPGLPEFYDGGSPSCELGRMTLFSQEAAVWGFLPADGRLVNIHEHPRLFALIGSKFGGDGTTTYGLPTWAAPAGMTWQICAFGASEPKTCVLSELGYQATEADMNTNWARARGSLLRISQQATMFELISNDYGGDGRNNFSLPNVPDPAPGVHSSICVFGSFPQAR